LHIFFIISHFWRQKSINKYIYFICQKDLLFIWLKVSWLFIGSFINLINKPEQNNNSNTICDRHKNIE